MKSILTKFKVDYSVYGLLLLALLSGYIKISLVVIVIVLVHELGHVITSIIFKYDIKSITIYPFGGVTCVDKLINTPINQELVVVSSGVIFQVLLYFVFCYLFNIGWITEYTYLLFLKYNMSILFFNLLPIIPLDGSLILRLFLEKFFSYKRTYNIYLVISIISLCLFICFTYKILVNNVIIISLLIYRLYIDFKNRKYLQKRFLLERYLYDLSYKEIRYLSNSDLSSLGKEKYYYFKSRDKVRSEKGLLRKLFDSSE